jgi:hypothetical protein
MARLTGVRDKINREIVDACQHYDGGPADRLLVLFDDPAQPIELQLEAGRRAFGIACLRKIAADG